jgi:hypothetical protein
MMQFGGEGAPTSGGKWRYHLQPCKNAVASRIGRFEKLVKLIGDKEH